MFCYIVAHLAYIQGNLLHYWSWVGLERTDFLQCSSVSLGAGGRGEGVFLWLQLKLVLQAVGVGPVSCQLAGCGSVKQPKTAVSEKETR